MVGRERRAARRTGGVYSQAGARRILSAVATDRSAMTRASIRLKHIEDRGRSMRDRLEKGGLDRARRGARRLLLSLNFSAVAQRETKLPIPYEDLQLFSAVFGRIKSDYVEPVPTTS